MVMTGIDLKLFEKHKTSFVRRRCVIRIWF